MPRKRPALNGTNGTAGVSTLPDATTQVALYMRVSSEEQAERGTIEAQRDFLRQFATLYQLSIAEEYADDGVTGTIVLGERPEGRRLLQDIATGRFGCVLLYRVDRLGRSLPALLDAHTALSKAGITIRSATEPFDTSTPIGTFLFQLLGSMAELDKSTIIERMTRGRDRVAKHGRWTDGPVPFGYDLDAERHLTPSNRWVDALGMTEADAARDLFRRMAEGSTTVLESRRFNALGIPTTRRYGNGTQATVGKKWRPSRIIGMLNNPVYIGRHVFNGKYGDVAREVPALLPPAVWEQAREQLQRNRSSREDASSV